jgi:hypothetical protein
MNNKTKKKVNKCIDDLIRTLLQASELEDKQCDKMLESVYTMQNDLECE